MSSPEINSSEKRWSRPPRTEEEFEELERCVREESEAYRKAEIRKRNEMNRYRSLVNYYGGEKGLELRLRWLALYCCKRKTSLVKTDDEYQDLIYYIIYIIGHGEVVDSDDDMSAYEQMAYDLVRYSIFYSKKIFDHQSIYAQNACDKGNIISYIPPRQRYKDEDDRIKDMIKLHSLIVKLLSRVNRTYEEFDDGKNLTTYSWTEEFDPLVIKVYKNMPDKFTKKEWDEMVVKNLVSVRTGARWIEALKKAQRLRRIGNHKNGYYIKIDGIDDEK